jgi:hypothetical protein
MDKLLLVIALPALSHFLYISLTSEEGVRAREREEESEKDGEREGEKEIIVVLFLKGMTGALAPFTYLAYL